MLTSLEFSIERKCLMQGVMKPLIRILAVGVSLFLLESGLAPLCAPEGAATIAGTILDQACKVIVAGPVTVEGGAAGFGKTATTAGEGPCSVRGCAAAA